MPAALTTADVDRALARKGPVLWFPRPLEEAYLKSYLLLRAPMVPVWASVGTILYCLGYLGDQTMMAPNADLLFWLRFGVFLPYGIAVIISMRLWPGARLYEALSIGVGLLGAFLPMSVLAVTQSPYAFIYQTGTVSTLLYMVVLLRPRFYAVVLGCVGILAIQLTATALNAGFDEVTYTGIVTFYVTFTLFLMLAAYGMEHGARRSFLEALRNQLLTEQFRHQSDHDDLSGLKNRRALTARLDHYFTAGAHRCVAAIMLDIDHFKLYNDAHGHMAGDACIRQVSDIVSTILGPRGEAFRYGGEEILVLLPDTPIAEALTLAEAIRAAIRAAAIPHRDQPEAPRFVTASLGVAEVDPLLETPLQLLARADAALYEAKRLGRNQVFWLAEAA